MFAVVLPQGKFRYTVLPQGTSASCDIFNIVTDGGIKGKEGVYKTLMTFLPPQTAVKRWKKYGESF